MWKLSWAPHYTLRLKKKVIGMKLGLHGFGAGLVRLVLGLHTHKKVQFDVDLWRGFYVDP
jgi:hypothetical protein